MSKFLKSLNVLLILGALILAFGVGQFFFFMLLDELGVIEVGNALGHGLLLYLCGALGFVFLFLGLILALVKAYRSG